MFPNTIDDDFGDLIDAVTLEQKPESKSRAKAPADLLQGDDIADICRTFANIMSRFSRSYYYQPKLAGPSGGDGESTHDYVRDYKAKFQVFVELFPRFAGGLNSSLDETVYNGVSLLVGERMHEMNLLKLNGEASPHGNGGSSLICNICVLQTRPMWCTTSTRTPTSPR